MTTIPGSDTMTAYPTDYKPMWEEAARSALIWRKRAEDLEEAIGEYILWQPGRRGHAAAHKRLVAVLRDEETDE